MGNTSTLIGPKDVADMLGVKRSTVYMWRYYDQLPEPVQVVARVPLWRRGDIIKWAKKTNRMDADGRVTINRPGRKR
jgi:predicted DNA-binding transcriptional regulator AlpA